MNIAAYGTMVETSVARDAFFNMQGFRTVGTAQDWIGWIHPWMQQRANHIWGILKNL